MHPRRYNNEIFAIMVTNCQERNVAAVVGGSKCRAFDLMSEMRDQLRESFEAIGKGVGELD
jgi:hypothetical protein